MWRIIHHVLQRLSPNRRALGTDFNIQENDEWPALSDLQGRRAQQTMGAFVI